MVFFFALILFPCRFPWFSRFRMFAELFIVLLAFLRHHFWWEHCVEFFFLKFFLLSIWVVQWNVISSALFYLENCRLQMSKGWITLLRTIKCLLLKLSTFRYLEDTPHHLVYQMVPVLLGMFIFVGLRKSIKYKKLSLTEHLMNSLGRDRASHVGHVLY